MSLLMIMNGNDVLISGGGIAGLTLGILLKERGFEPVIIERTPSLRTEGYMMDFFGSGWDVAERMGLDGDIRKVTYSFEGLEYVDSYGNPRFPPVPLERIRNALKGRYAPIRRQDLESILYHRATSLGVPVKFGTEIGSLQENEKDISVKFRDGTEDRFGLLFGADGVHSRVRELVFGQESQFERFLGYYVAAFHLEGHGYDIGHLSKIYEEPCRMAWIYPTGRDRMDAMYIFCHKEAGRLLPQERLRLLNEQCRGMGWIAGDILTHIRESPLYFDSATQIIMPSWHTGRTVLLGDACGCLTLVAAQGSQMAMAGAYVLASELEKHHGDPFTAFPAYERFLRPFIDRKQKEAVRTAKTLVPRSALQMKFRYPLMRFALSRYILPYFFAGFGVKSILEGYH